MRRLNLPEIEDQSWCPTWLRNYTTDFLQIFMTRLDPYASVRPLLLEALRHCGTQRIVDLCSGGGGPWPRIYPEIMQQMAEQPKLWLTDLYPNQQSCGDLQRQFPEKVKWWPKPMAACNLPPTLPGFITQFSATHHLSPDELQQLLLQSVEQRRGIAFFEVAHRSLPAMLLVFFVPLAVWLLTPGQRPVTLGRIFFTAFQKAADSGDLSGGAAQRLIDGVRGQKPGFHVGLRKYAPFWIRSYFCLRPCADERSSPSRSLVI